MASRGAGETSADIATFEGFNLSHGMQRVRLFAASAMLCGAVACAAPAAHAQATANCQSLLSFSYPNATITGASSSAGGPYCGTDTWHICFSNLPPSCQVTATISPVSGSSIGVTVWMPTEGYNGRYLGTGNGGYAGSYFDSELAQGINEGFATANTDMGTSQCLSYGVNAQFCAEYPQSWVDFGWRATTSMTQFAKALIAAFYGSAPNYSYFAGCSTGGQQALMEAQRFPNDYNGILAGDPANDRTHLHVVPVAQYSATHSSTTGAPSSGYIPTPSGFDTVNAAVLAQCVGRDGGAASDTFLNNPRVCRFNPATLQCPNNNAGPSCLTSDQIAAFQQYYQGPVDPVTGASIYPGNAPGSEADTALGLGMAYNENLNEPSFDGLFYWVFGLTWQWETFDFNTNVAQVDQALGADLNATSTDLSGFKNAGGKLIQYHGWADPLIPSIGSINYYNAVTKTMFGNVSNSTTQQTQNFYRLYMVPGMWHCGDSLAGGPGPNSFGGMIQQPPPSYDPQHNLLSALTQWVENGTPPGPAIATKYVEDTPSLGIAMQRPICVYPQVAQYDGSGDPTQPGSFSCQNGPNVAIHDFDNDGVSDILWRDTSGDLAIWLMGAAQESAGATLGSAGASWSVVGTRDFNGDGKADILWLDNTGDLGIWEMNGASVSAQIGLGNVGAQWSVVGTGDFNGDGTADILWRDSSGDLAIWLMSNGQFSSGVSLGQAASAWSVAGTGDFNGDGNSDILWRNMQTGDLAIWFMSNGQVSSAVDLANVSLAWSVAGIGDFNGDGTSDILWRDTSGDYAIWLMNNGQFSSGETIAAGISSVWSVAETGDFNGDGQSDILWRDQSGDLGVWLMNGTTVSSAIGLGNVGASWQVQGENAD